MADSSILDRVRDTAGLYEHVLREVRGDPTDDFYSALVDAVAGENAITISDAVKKDVAARLKLQGLEIGYNRPEAQVLAAIQDVREESPWADKITKFAPKIDGGIPADVRERMLAYLQPLPVDPDTASAQTVTTYLTLAYEESTRKASSSSDPIALTRPVGSISSWDYRIDPFDDVAYQVILASSIRAAGALAWVYEIGERLGVFKLADTLVMRWATGNVDFSSPTLVSQLYRYWQLRDDRMSPEDRGLLYRRVLSVSPEDASVRQSLRFCMMELADSVTLRLRR